MRSPSQRGFTLLELMVVVVLIGIILTVVVQSIGDGGRRERIQREANRLQALVELVGEESVLKSAVIGLRFDMTGYTFMRLEEKAWREVVNDDLLKPHNFIDGIEPELLVEGMEVEVKARSDKESEGDEEKLKPQIVFLPSGERTAFELTLHYENEEAGYRLAVPPLGDLELRYMEGV